MEKTHQSHAPGGGHMGDTSVTCTRQRSHGRHISHMHPAEVTWETHQSHAPGRGHVEKQFQNHIKQPSFKHRGDVVSASRKHCINIE